MHHGADLLTPTLLGTYAQCLQDWEWLALKLLLSLGIQPFCPFVTGQALLKSNGHVIFLTKPGSGLGTWLESISLNLQQLCKRIETQR